MNVAELETPVAVVDLDVVERHVAEAADYARRHGLDLMPHAKTHKTLAIAMRQLDAGAAGLTVAKTQEAASYASRGLGPLLVHYPPYGLRKWERLAEVAGQVPLTVALDSMTVAEPLARALRAHGRTAWALVELDVGLHRTGVDIGGALDLAQGIDRLGGGLEPIGLSCYPGHLRGGNVSDGLRRVDDMLRSARERLEAAGLRCVRISGGSTATFLHAHETVITEIRPGNYVFLDRTETASHENCALRIHATVISTSVPGQAVVDAGSKALSEAHPPPGLTGFGAIVGHEEVELVAVNEEHGYLDISASSTSWCVGDRVEIIPNHACTCVNLHDELVGVRCGLVEERLPLIARGMIR